MKKILLLFFVSIAFTFNTSAQCPTSATPDFSAADICFGDTLKITDLSSGVDPNMHRYFWDFEGDGVIDDSTTMGDNMFIPSVADTFHVTLTITDTVGCLSLVSYDVIAFSRPVATFIADTVCVGNVSTFTNNSTGTGTAPAYSWDFDGDGVTDDNTIGSTTFTYPAAGVFDAILTITGDGGCISADTNTVLVNARPTVDFTADTVCEGNATTFTDNSTDTGTAPVYSWDFDGDGFADDNTVGSLTYTYPAATIVNAILIIHGDGGCTSSVSSTVLVNGAPVADFTTDTVCAGNITTFTDNSSNMGTAPFYSWDFDGDNISDDNTTGSVIYAYSAGSTFNASLTITGDGGCTSTLTKAVLVSESPVASFTTSPASACVGSTVTFNDASTGVDGSSIYAWDIDNNGTVDYTTQGSIQHTYSSIGMHVASLEVVNAGGCSGSFTKNINITASTISVSAGVDKTIICGSAATLNAVSNQTSGVTYTWLPATDLNNPFVAAPSSSPNLTTTYKVTATKAGCSSVDSVVVNVTPLIVSAGIDPTIICGNSISITSTVNNAAGAIYSWSPTTGLSNAAAATSSASPSQTTTYVLSVAKGLCTAKDTVVVNVTPLQISAGSDKTVICASSVALPTSVNNSSGIAYNWSPTLGLNNTATASPTASPSSTTTYVVTATKNSCIAHDTVVVNVTPYSINAGSDKTIICGASTTLSSTVSNVSSPVYSWLPTSGLSNPFSASPTVSVNANTTYVLSVSKNGCTSTDTVNVNVNPQLPLAFTANKTITNTLPYAIIFSNQTSTISNYTYTWLFGDGTTSSVTSPTHTYGNSGAYTVSLVAQTSNGQCSDTLTQANYIQCLSPAGINAQELSNEISIYPNPSKGLFNVEFGVSCKNVSLTLYDITGQKINEENLEVTGTGKSYNLQTNGLNNGIYFLLIKTADQVITKKLMIN